MQVTNVNGMGREVNEWEHSGHKGREIKSKKKKKNDIMYPRKRVKKKKDQHLPTKEKVVCISEPSLIQRTRPNFSNSAWVDVKELLCTADSQGAGRD